MADQLVVRGAREHNLKDVSLDLPRDALIVFTGLSGSGKSSLAFDTIFAEGQRRYVESLSAYARQFLGQMDKPDVDFIEGLSPGGLDRPEVDRREPALDRRHDHRGLRLPAAAVRPGRPAALPGLRRADRPADAAADRRPGADARRRAPGSRCSRRSSAAARASTSTCSGSSQTKGFSRARVDGETVTRSTEPPKLDKQKKHTIEVVVDRLAVKASAKQRLTDSVETALGLASGLVVARLRRPARERPAAASGGSPSSWPARTTTLSHRRARAAVVLVQLARSAPARSCHGLGTRMEVDPELVVPDAEKTPRRGRDRALVAGATSPTTSSGCSTRWPRSWASAPTRRGTSSRARGRKTILLTATRPRSTSATSNRYGRERSYYAKFEGVIPYIERRHARGRDRHLPGAVRGLHARGAVPGLPRAPG